MHHPLSMLAYYVHNLDPYVFKIGPWGPRWYGLAYLAGFFFAYLLIKKNSRDGMLRLNPERVPDLVLNCCIFGVLIGGRLGFVLFYDLPIALNAGRTPLLWDFSPISPGSSVPFWGVLKVWDGGMAAHGGIVFTILTLMVFAWRQFGKPTRVHIAILILGTFLLGTVGWSFGHYVLRIRDLEIPAAMMMGVDWMVYYGWRHSIPAINLGDAACMVVPIGLFFGRIANFINGELYGHPTTVPWAVKFPSEIYAPTNGQIDPAVNGKLLGLFASLNLPISWSSPDPIAQGAEILHARLMNHDPQALAAVAAIIPARHPSQLYEALLEGLLLFIICWTIGRKWRKDGMASGAFLTFYPIMRIIGEQFRVGDTPAPVFGMDLSKGVLYSLPLVAAGAIYWAYFIVRSKPRPWQGFPVEAAKGPAKSEAKPTQGT